MDPTLLQPSLQGVEYQQVEKVYNIHNMFFVAFFFGVLPAMVLGSRNAKWFRCNIILINTLLVLGGMIMIANAICAASIDLGYITITPRTMRYIFRFLSLGIYLAFYFLTHFPYNMHILMGGETRPLLKDGVIWFITGNVIQMVLLVMMGGMIH